MVLDYGCILSQAMRDERLPIPTLSESQFRKRNKWVLDHLKEIRFFFSMKTQGIYFHEFSRAEWNIWLYYYYYYFFAGGLEFAVMLLYSLFISEPIDMCGSDYSLFMFLFMIATTKNVLVGNTWPFFFMLLYKRGFFFAFKTWRMLKLFFKNCELLIIHFRAGMTFQISKINENLTSIWPCLHED